MLPKDRNEDEKEGEVHVRIIKRYRNRKLYDTDTSCYVTLEEIGQMIHDEEEVRVIDNRNGDDLTSVTLAQIIFETEKKSRSLLPIYALKKIIQTGGDSLRGFVQKSLDTGVSSISNVKDEAGKVFDKIKDEIEDKIEDGGGFIKEVFQKANKNIDDLQRKVEDRIKHPFGANSSVELPNVKDKIQDLRKKLADLEKKLK